MPETVEFPSIVIKRRVVPNVQPIADPGSQRIAIVGEAPGEEEENHGQPFVGKSGNFLNGILREVGIDRFKCFMGNVCQVRPPANRIEAFDWNGPEIQDGLKQLAEDIRIYNPNIVVCLGGTPLRAASGSIKKITEWRGSLFRSLDLGSPMFQRKCISSLHPAFVLREFSGYPLLKFDLKRARDEASSPELNLPQRELLTNLTASELIYIMDSWPSGQRCSLDIEGGLEGWPCVSICARPAKSITIAWGKFTEAEHAKVLRSFAGLMSRIDVPKVLQNSLYDNFVLAYGYGILIRNVAEDTMIKSWEIYAELPRSLGVQTSIWTREPFYKADRKSDNVETFYQYCAKDSAVTLEICQAQDTVLNGASLTHYRKMLEILNPFHYMEQRGIKYDQASVTIKLTETKTKLADCRERIGQSAGCELFGPTSLSPKKLCAYLYDKAGYPPQFKKEQGRKTEKLTSDIEALLTLKRHRPHDELLNDLLLHRHLEGVRETLSITADSDGRVRCGYSLEAETGRVKCYTSPTGSGANLQTIQKDLRGNYVADEGYDFFQCDLEGADGWTVACHSARLGDGRMFHDYSLGMKPAKLIALMYWFGNVINDLDDESLKFHHDFTFPIVKKQAGAWLYLGCKRVQHGSSYLMGIPTMVLNVLRDSYKESGTPIYMEHSDARFLQSGCFFARYPGVQSWHNWSEAKLVADGKLTAASGHTRIFFGRRFGRDIKDTVKEFLAHEPQNNTTWATNLAMLNLWNDPENRRSDGSLIIEPFHQVHDALCGQWPTQVRDWARRKVRSYFNNTLTIAGRDIVIPFDGTFGPSWGDMPEKI